MKRALKLLILIFVSTIAVLLLIKINKTRIKLDTTELKMMNSNKNNETLFLEIQQGVSMYNMVGDVNQDSFITLLDSKMIYNQVNENPDETFNDELGDIDKDKELTNADAETVRNLALYINDYRENIKQGTSLPPTIETLGREYLINCNTIQIGQELIIAPQSTLSEISYLEELTAVSSDPNVATAVVEVDEYGISSVRVTGVGIGTAEIAVALKNTPLSAGEINLRVTSDGMISGTDENLNSMYIGDAKTLKLLYDGVQISNVEWNSSNTEILTVNSNGVAKGISPGTATITASDGYKEIDSVRITVNNYIAGIEVTEPTNTNYLYGQDLDLAGGTVRTVMADGTKGDPVNLTEGMISGYDKNKLGEQEITVTYEYEGNIYTDKFIVIVTEIQIVGIEITEPSKKEYLYGEDLDLTDGTVRLVMEDGSKKEPVNLKNEMISGYDKNKLGEQEITVTYSGKTKSFTVTVNNYVTGIKVEGPSKTDYLYGQDLDLAGGTVRTVMADGTKGDQVDLTEGMISGYNKNQLGEQEITVTYLEKTASFTVTVNNYVAGIEITEPTKTEYRLRQELDLTGGTVRIVMADGTKGNPANLTNAMISGYNKNQLGEQEITVTYEYEGKTYTSKFKVIVAEREITEIEIKEGTVPKTYKDGEDLDLTNAKLLAKYNNGETEEKEITQNMISGYNKETTRDSEVEIIVMYEGKTTSFIVKRKVLKDGLFEENSNYEIIGGYIINISPKTKIKDFKKEIDESCEITVDDGEKEITDEDIQIKTNMKVKIKKNEATANEYILVVKGDCTGNGTSTVEDLTTLMMSIVESISIKKEEDKILKGAFKIAADLNGDSKLSVSDITLLSKYIVDNK